MPKILINEKDKTTPGAPAGYSNYSVLIAGYQKEFSEAELATANKELEDYATAKARIAAGEENVVLPELSNVALMLKARQDAVDSNGVYEFNEAQDFLDTIGPVPPTAKVTVVNSDNGELAAVPGEKSGIATIEIKHYGNQMAYELLKQGYSVIYLPIKPENCGASLTNTNTWEIFKDKATYDFRFISHGLLESTNTTALNNKKLTLDTAINILNTHVLNYADPDISDETFELTKNTVVTNELLESVDARASLYSALFGKLNNNEIANSTGLIDSTTNTYYTSCREAVIGIFSELQKIEAVLDFCITENVINDANMQIANLAKYEATGLKDADGDATNNMTTTEITGRGDCVALIELDEKAYLNTVDRPENAIMTAIGKMSDITKANGKYCAMTVPSVVYRMSGNAAYAENKKFPGAFHYLACFMNSLQSGFNEWYAAAGYTRGVSSYTIDYTTVTLGEVAINALEPRNKGTSGLKFACNVIANFRGSHYLWGNRTAHPLGDANGNEGDLVASHFLNIRQLCTTIKKQLYVACRRFTFDPNSDTLWFNFVNAIRPTLDIMKADQGIRDYKIVKITDNPKKATMKAKIRIIPIEAVEDFDLTVSLEDSFGETAAVVTE